MVFIGFSANLGSYCYTSVLPTPRLRKKKERNQQTIRRAITAPNKSSRRSRAIKGVLCRRCRRFDALFLCIRGTIHLWEVAHVCQSRSFHRGWWFVRATVLRSSPARHANPACRIHGRINEVSSVGSRRAIGSLRRSLWIVWLRLSIRCTSQCTIQ